MIDPGFNRPDWVTLENNIAGTEALVLYESGNILYVCKAQMGSLKDSPVWQIRKIDTSVGVIIQWCDSDSKYDNVATDLATVAGLTYG